MLFPCASPCISCPGQGNLDYDRPIANLTSEKPDAPEFVSVFEPGGQGDETPPLGSTFTALGCISVCESTVSQDAADLCAQQQASICTWGQWYPPATPPFPGPTFEPGTSEPLPGELGGAEAPGPGGGIPVPYPLYPNHVAICGYACPDGSPCSSTVPAGWFMARSQAEADLMALSNACARAGEICICLSDCGGTVCVGEGFSCTIRVTGRGTPPFTLSVSDGGLPPGLSLAQTGDSSATISGTTTQVGDFTFTIQATDFLGNPQTRQYSITVIGIVPTSLPGGYVGEPYFAQLTMQGAENYLFIGDLAQYLPPGLALQPDGAILGTPTEIGVYPFKVCAIDQDGLICCQKESITITNEGPIPCHTFAWKNCGNYFGDTGEATITGSGCTFQTGAVAGSLLMPNPNPPPSWVFREPPGSPAFCNAMGTVGYKAGLTHCRLHMAGSQQASDCMAPYILFWLRINGGPPFQSGGLSGSPEEYFQYQLDGQDHWWNFDLPDTGGATWTFEIDVSTGAYGASYWSCSCSGGGWIEFL